MTLLRTSGYFLNVQEGMTVLRNIPIFVEKKTEIHRDIVTGRFWCG